MKVGGRRVLVIPPDLAYGAQSPSPDIKANETLVFVVDLEKTT
jgi:peptidylprolyl isomerase